MVAPRIALLKPVLERLDVQLKAQDADALSLLPLSKQYHIIRPVQAKAGIFIYLVLDRAKANLAMARRACQDCESGLSF